jgi:cytochrome c oxidase subunit 2
MLILVNSALADDIVLAPQKFSHCVTCHGVELTGNRSVDAPNLSVLESWYVEKQLTAFVNLWRGHAGDEHGMEMRPMVVALTDADRAEVIRFVASVPRRAAAKTIIGDLVAGEMVYGTCSVCHGARAEGNRDFDAPALVGQSDWYLARQLDKYKSGNRGAATGDISGAQMRAAAGILMDATDIKNVVAYINSLASH